MSKLKLIVGLGNPGAQYDATRHNAGAEWLKTIADQAQIPLALDPKFKGLLGRGTVLGVELRLLIPTTYMNRSGDSVGALARYYKIEPQEILVAYDEVAFAPGVVKLRHGGGDNGHNGVKSVSSGLGGKAEFYRLRIGVGHPGDKAQVVHYLTEQKPPLVERELIQSSLVWPDQLLCDVVHGRWQAAINALHGRGTERKPSGSSDNEAYKKDQQKAEHRMKERSENQDSPPSAQL